MPQSAALRPAAAPPPDLALGPSQPGALPKYLQIAELLARDVAAGRLQPGQRLPPERDLAANFGIAPGTLRAALAELDRRGMLDRRHGSGNYIRPGAPALAGSVYALFRLELATGGGGLPTAQVLALDRRAKDPALPPFGTAPDAVRIRRLRRLNGLPAAVEEIWLDGAVAGAMTADDLSESLYHHYRTRLNLTIARAEDRVGQAPVPDWAPAGFAPAPGQAVPMITRLAFPPAGAAVEASRTWIDPGVAVYVARLA